MKMNVQAFKIGSGECNNYPLLEHVAQAHKPVILSTGMNTIASIRKAVDIFNRYRVPVALLHTTNLYPTPFNLVRLGAMQEMAEAFPNCVYGLSDHTTNNLACLSAVTLGASIVERHFTDRMDRKGPDICCSMDEQAARELIEQSRIIHSMRGGHKGPLPGRAGNHRFCLCYRCHDSSGEKRGMFYKRQYLGETSGNGWYPGRGI